MNTQQAIGACALAMSLAVAAPVMAQTAKPPAEAVKPAAPPVERSEREQRAAQILGQMLDPQIAASMARKQPTGGFAGDMTRLAVENVYEQLWTRPGLSLRDRSMVTISMLIALGAEAELKTHLEAALRNGVTPREIEEIVYQASAYVGFPRATAALIVASKVITGQAPQR